MDERWIRAVLRHQRLVVLGWALAAVAGALAGSRLPDISSNTFGVPGTDSERARVVLEHDFGERPDGTFVVAFPASHPSDPAVRRTIRTQLAAAARAVPGGTPAGLETARGLVYGRISTPLSLQQAKSYTTAIRAALRQAGARGALVTGAPALQDDLDPIVADDLRRAELIALPIALAVLVALLGLSLAVAIPFVFAAVTISVSLGLVWAIAHTAPTATYVTNLVVLVGLGLAIDYSMLVVHRFRRELTAAGTREDAVVAAMATAGKAIAFSAIAVAIGLGALLFVPVPFIQSLGLGGLVVPLVSLAAVATLQPVLLDRLGGSPRGAAAPDGHRWAGFGSLVTRRPWLFLATGLCVLAPLAAVATTMRVTPGSVASIPGPSEAVSGFALLDERLGPGIVAPTQIVVDAGRDGDARSAELRAAVRRLVDSTAPDPEVQAVAYGKRSPYVDARGRYARVVVIGLHDYGAPQTRRLVERLRDELVPAARFPSGTRVLVGGAPPQGVDFVARAYGAFPWLAAVVLALTFGTLAWAFRSLLLPLQAVLLNVLSVGAAYGLLTLVVQHGVGASLLGMEQAGAIEAWVPIVLFALLFGLSMDYEVFVVAPMREAWEHGAGTSAAVVAGVARTGRIVTAAALIMVAVFSGFVAGRVPGLQQLGLGLALGILLDATVVRLLLVPSLVTLSGAAAWWLPRRVEAILPRSPSPH